MRVLSLFVLLACACAIVVAQPEVAAVVPDVVATPAVVPAAADVVPVVPAPVVAAPVVAAPAPAACSAMKAVQQSVDELAIAQSATASQLKSAQAAIDAKIAALAQTVEQGLNKLYAADDAQTAADEAQQKSAAAAAAAASSAASNTDSAATLAAATATQSRLESVERELSDLKKVLAGFVASQTAAQQAKVAAQAAAPKTIPSDPILAEIKANQILILAQLATASAPFSFDFDYETVVAQAKNKTVATATKLSKFVQKTYTTVLANYPTYIEQAKQFGQQGLVQAEVFRVQATEASADARFRLGEFLQAKGVPAEQVQNVILGAFALVVLIALIIFVSILKCVCRCCCCCGKRKQKANSKPIKNNNKGGKAEEKSA